MTNALSRTTPICLLLAACAIDPSEPRGSTDESVVCTTDSDPSSGCTSGNKGRPPPAPVAYVTVSTSETTATVDFLTQRDATSATVAVRDASGVVATVSDAPTVVHSLPVSSLRPCATYSFAILLAGTSVYEGTFTMRAGSISSLTVDATWGRAITFDFDTDTSVPAQIALYEPGGAKYVTSSSIGPTGTHHTLTVRVAPPLVELPEYQYVVGAPGGCTYKVDRVATQWWPASSSLEPTREHGYDYPSRAKPGWSNHVQGAAHDASSWFVSNEWSVVKIPVDRDLASPSSVVARAALADIPGNCGGIVCVYNHFGDLGYGYDGKLYVPVEGMTTPIVAAFDTSLAFVAKATLTDQGAAPWAAVNPLDGLLYTSEFDITTGNGLRMYAMHWTGGALSLSFLKRIDLLDKSGAPLAVRRVQGGEFSDDGHLYLVGDTTGGGIEGFDLVTRKRMVHVPVDYDPSPHDLVVTTASGQELEGITLWDRRDGRAPNVYGQVHVLMDDPFTIGDDYVYFKHYGIYDAKNLSKL